MNLAPKIIKDEGYSIFNLVVIFLHPEKGPKNIEHAIYMYIIVGKVWSITAYTLSINQNLGRSTLALSLPSTTTALSTIAVTLLC